MSNPYKDAANLAEAKTSHGGIVGYPNLENPANYKKIFAIMYAMRAYNNGVFTHRSYSKTIMTE